MFSRVSHALKIYLREKCVDETLLSISCSFLPLHPLAFSAVPKSRFESWGLGNSKQVHSFVLFKMFLQVSRVENVFTWKIRDVKLMRYQVVFFHSNVSRLAMCPSRVFSLGIFEILNRCIVSPALKWPSGCLTRGMRDRSMQNWRGNSANWLVNSKQTCLTGPLEYKYRVIGHHWASADPLSSKIVHRWFTSAWLIQPRLHWKSQRA